MRALILRSGVRSHAREKQWSSGPLALNRLSRPVFAVLPRLLSSATLADGEIPRGVPVSSAASPSDATGRPTRHAPAKDLLLPLPAMSTRLGELENRHLDYYAEQAPLHPDVAGVDPIVVLRLAASTEIGARSLSPAELDAALEALNRAGSLASDLTEDARREAVDMLFDPAPRFAVLEQLSLFALSRMCRVSSEAYVSALHMLAEAGAKLANGEKDAARMVVGAEKARRAALVLQRSLITILKQVEDRGQVRILGRLGAYQWLDSIWAILESHTVAAHVPVFSDAEAFGHEVRQRGLQIQAEKAAAAGAAGGAGQPHPSTGTGAGAGTVERDFPAPLMQFEEAPTSDALVNACLGSLGRSIRTVLGDLSGPMNYDFGRADASGGTGKGTSSPQVTTAELHELRLHEDRAKLTPVARAVLRTSFGHELTHLVAATRIAAAWTLQAEHPLTPRRPRANSSSRGVSAYQYSRQSRARAPVAPVDHSLTSASAVDTASNVPIGATNSDTLDLSGSVAVELAGADAGRGIAASAPASGPAEPISRYSPASDVCSIVNGDIFLRIWSKSSGSSEAVQLPATDADALGGGAAAGDSSGDSSANPTAQVQRTPLPLHSRASSRSLAVTISEPEVVPKPTPRLLLSLRLAAMLVQCSPASLPSLDAGLSRCDAAAIAAFKAGCLGPSLKRLRREHAFLAVLQTRRYIGAWSPAFSLALRNTIGKHVSGTKRFHEVMNESIDCEAGEKALVSLADVPEELPAPLVPGAGPLRQLVPLPCRSGSPVFILDALSQSVHLLSEVSLPPVRDAVAGMLAMVQTVGFVGTAQSALRLVAEVQRRFGPHALTTASPHRGLVSEVGTDFRSLRLPSAAVCATVARFDADVQRAASLVAALDWPAIERWEAEYRAVMIAEAEAAAAARAWASRRGVASGKPREPHTPHHSRWAFVPKVVPSKAATLPPPPLPPPVDLLSGLHSCRSATIPALVAARTAAAIAAASDTDPREAVVNAERAVSAVSTVSAVSSAALSRDLPLTLRRIAEARVLVETASDCLADWAAMHHSIAPSVAACAEENRAAVYAGAKQAVLHLAHVLRRCVRAMRAADALLAACDKSRAGDTERATAETETADVRPDPRLVTALRCESARLHASYVHALLRLRQLAVLDAAVPPASALPSVQSGSESREAGAGPGAAVSSPPKTPAGELAAAAGPPSTDTATMLADALAAAASAVVPRAALPPDTAQRLQTAASAKPAALPRGPLLASASALAASSYASARLKQQSAPNSAQAVTQTVSDGKAAAAAASAAGPSSRMAALTAALSAGVVAPAPATGLDATPEAAPATASGAGSASECVDGQKPGTGTRHRRLLPGWMSAAAERLVLPQQWQHTLQRLRAASEVVDEVTDAARAAAEADADAASASDEDAAEGELEGNGEEEGGVDGVSREGLDVDEGEGPDAAAALLAPRFDAAEGLLLSHAAVSAARPDAPPLREDSVDSVASSLSPIHAQAPTRVHERSCALLLHVAETLCRQRGWAIPVRDFRFAGNVVASEREGESGRLLPLPPHGDRAGSWLAWPAAKCALVFLRPDELVAPPLEDCAAQLLPLLSALPAHPRAMFAAVPSASARSGGLAVQRRERMPGLATALEQAGWAVAIVTTADGAVVDCVHDLRQWQFLEKERGVPPDVAQALRDSGFDSSSIAQLRLSQTMPVIRDTVMRCISTAGIGERIEGKLG